MPEIHIRPAAADDAGIMLRFIHELAAFEHQADQVRATEADLRRDGWGATPVFEALIAELDGAPAGFVMIFRNYSTWKGRAGLFVEDLYVRESARGHGIGRRLLQAVAALAVARGCQRVDLNVLHWNPAREFYETLGFRELEAWRPYRLTGTAIAALAGSGQE